MLGRVVRDEQTTALSPLGDQGLVGLGWGHHTINQGRHAVVTPAELGSPDTAAPGSMWHRQNLQPNDKMNENGTGMGGGGRNTHIQQKGEGRGEREANKFKILTTGECG